MTIQLTTRPSRLNVAGMRQELQRGVEDFAENNIKRDFLSTIRTWRNRPIFKTRKRYNTRQISNTVGTQSKIYRFVSRGTRVRYATMTPNFSPKTIPRMLGSRYGRGGVLFISRRRPRPGIKARQYEETIYKKQNPRFYNHMKQYFNRAARQSRHGR